MRRKGIRISFSFFLTAFCFRLVAGGTDNHLLIVDLRTFDEEITGAEAQVVLDEAGITGTDIARVLRRHRR